MCRDGLLGAGLLGSDLLNGPIVKGVSSPIKSLQTIPFSSTAVNIDILLNTPVDPNIATVQFNFEIRSSNAHRETLVPYQGHGFLNNSTVRLYNPSGIQKNGYLTVIEYNGVKSKQSGVVPCSVANQEDVAEISPVNPEKCILIAYCSSAQDISNMTYLSLVYRIIDSTHLGFTMKDGGNNSRAYWQLLEFE